MNLSRLNYLFIPLVILTGYGLFFVKDTVIHSTHRLNEIKRQISLEKEKISIIKAELTYLTSGSKIRDLAFKLGLRASEASQIIDDLSNSGEAKQNKKDFAEIHKDKPKWRYKKLPGKYISTVSHGKK